MRDPRGLLLLKAGASTGATAEARSKAETPMLSETIGTGKHIVKPKSHEEEQEQRYGHHYQTVTQGVILVECHHVMRLHTDT